jgi:predicted RND superfamily exporter protein
MTSLTTACGLFSFAWADMATVAQLGWVAPAGVLFALLYTIILLPALIAIFPMKPGKTSQAKTGRYDQLFRRIAQVSTGRPVAVTLLFTVFILVAMYSASTLRFSHNISTWFPEDAPVRQATTFLDTMNGGSVMLEGLIDTGKENALYEPELLQRLEQAVTEVSTFEVAGIATGKAWALPDVLKETNRALHANQAAAYTLPDSRELTAQELILFESSGSDDLEDFADSQYSTARFSIMGPFEDAILYAEYTDEVQRYLQQQFPESTITLTGKTSLFVQIVNNAVTTMAKSYSISLFIITLLMIALVGKIRIGLLSMVANVAPIIFVLGLMGLQGIPLDLSTMLVGSLVLGIVVDDTIHFLHHFRRAFEATADVRQAVEETLLSTGRAMFITSMVLCGGFFIYMVGSLANNIRFGIISGCAIIFALLADFFLIPALLSLVYRKH